MSLEILEFRQVRTTDAYNPSRYGHWSRFYEYPIVNQFLQERLSKGAKIHNTCWGWEPPNHTDFKEDLENYFGVENVINSDLNQSNLPNTTVYDITIPPREEWLESFDAVLNISTLEEIKSDQIQCFNNLLNQVKVGGYLVITFDLPGFDLPKFEEYLGAEFTYVENFIYHPPKWGFTEVGLTVGLLFCKKV